MAPGWTSTSAIFAATAIAGCIVGGGGMESRFESLFEEEGSIPWGESVERSFFVEPGVVILRVGLSFAPSVLGPTVDEGAGGTWTLDGPNGTRLAEFHATAANRTFQDDWPAPISGEYVIRLTADEPLPQVPLVPVTESSQWTAGAFVAFPRSNESSVVTPART